MSQATLPASPSSEFPQVLDLAIQLGICQYEHPETFSGACDGFPCANTATIFSLSDEREYCAKHFLGVNRGN